VRTIHKVGVAGASGAAVIAAVLSFTTKWEGTDLVAKRDAIGTGHPVTYCHGQTSEFGDVKVGQRFTPAQCKEKLAASMPKYLAGIDPCIKREIPVKTKAALLDAAYNAGPAAVCHSRMVALMNEGKIEAGCKAFPTWYVRSDGQVRRGLINRRNDEMKLCLEGLTEDVNRAAKADRSPVPDAHHYGWIDYLRNWWRLHFS
jgi:lysozyme